MIVIGLGHYSRTGKDTTANYLIDCLSEYQSNLKVLKRSLAWKLKQICFELYGWAGIKPPEHYETKEGEKDRDIKLPLLNNMTPVEVWVAFGTKAVRNNVYDRTWLDYLLLTDHKCDILVIPDVRFPNEADAIKETGGLAIKVVRPGFGPRKTVADRALMGYDGWDYVIGAEGTMASLQCWASKFAHYLATGMNKPSQTKAEREAALKVESVEPWQP
jgi:hypothetical protein